MTEEQLGDFINDGGIEKIGHAAFSLLSVIVDKAKKEGYPKVIEMSTREAMYKAKLKSYQHLKAARDTLIKNECIDSYVPQGNVGYFYLNYK